MMQVVGHLSNKHEALSTIPSTVNWEPSTEKREKEKKRKNRKKERGRKEGRKLINK
jgi:hypothetical protein